MVAIVSYILCVACLGACGIALTWYHSLWREKTIEQFYVSGRLFGMMNGR